MYIIVHRATFISIGMTKAFGFFPTIDQEYNKKQVDSKYFFIEIIVSSTINAHNLSLLSSNSH
jgi:hypothetical protein